MDVSRQTKHTPQPSEPYTPTPDGFESRLRVWVGLPADGVSTPAVEGANHPQERLGLGTMPEHDHMRTISIRRLLPLVGMGLMLVVLFGGPVVSAAEPELFTYQNDWSARYPWGPPDYRGTRDPWRPQDPWGYRPPRAGLGYGLPDRYTIHKGKKCELRCERIRGSREYTCREYRC
jgi:hypothetical protein